MEYKLIVVDPSLRDHIGHQYLFAKMIQVGAAQWKMPCKTLICKRNNVHEDWAVPVFRADVMLPFFTVKRLFLLFKPHKSAGARPETVRRLQSTTKDPSGLVKVIVNVLDLLNIFYLNLFFFLDLRKAMSKETITPATYVWMVGIWRYNAFGYWLWMWWRQHRDGWWPNTILNFRDYPSRHPYLKLIAWLFKGKAKFVADNRRQRYEFSHVTGVPFYSYFVPVLHLRFPSSQSSRRTFGFIGGFRMAKGVDVIAQALERVVEDLTCGDIYHTSRFFIQCNRNLLDQETAAIFKRLQDIAAAHPKFLRLFTEELDEIGYYQLLSKIDVVLAPFKKSYIGKPSGVLTDALVYRKPVIAPAYARPGDMPDVDYDPGYVWECNSEDPDSLIQACRALRMPDIYAQFVDAVKEESLLYREQCSPKLFVSHMLWGS